MNSESVAKWKCIGSDCENDAGTLQCPTCLKLGIKESFFCSQDCFKRNWVSLPRRILPNLRASCEENYARDPPSENNQSQPCGRCRFSILWPLLTGYRAHIGQYIKHRVGFLVISYPRRLFLNPIQIRAYTTLFQPSHTLAHYGLSTHCLNGGLCQNQ